MTSNPDFLGSTQFPKNYNIQGLRALAAYGVVVHHIVDGLRNYIAIDRFTANPSTGSTGVDLFFVISGYVMVLTTSTKHVSPLAFLHHRIKRVVPMYWLLTVIATMLILLGFKIFGTIPTDLQRIMTSFFFLPNFDGARVALQPIVFPGWTLNYEMMFYLLFAAWLFVPSAAIRLWGVIASIMTVWLLQVITASYWLDYLGADIVVSFAFGMLLWPLAQRYRLPLTAAFGAIPLALFALASIDMPVITALPHSRIIVAIGSALLVYAAISLERDGRTIGQGWLARQGDASYSLYLTHPFVLQIIGKLSVVTHVNTTTSGLVLTVIAMLFASGVVGMLVHRCIENPINRLLRGRSIEGTMAVATDPKRSSKIASV